MSRDLSLSYLKQTIFSVRAVIIFICFVWFFLSETAGSFFGVDFKESSLKYALAFNPSQPFANQGLSLLFSFIPHESLIHLLMNAALFLYSARLYELRWSRVKFISFFFTLQLLSLVLIYLSHSVFYRGELEHLYFGLSSICLILISLSFFENHIFKVLTFVLHFIYLFEISQKGMNVDSFIHTSSLSLGLIIAFSRLHFVQKSKA